MNALTWYNLVAPVYNLLNLGDRLYRDARRQAVQRLGLETGGVVVDLFCGTGVNFEPIREALGDSGRVIAVDGSARMLARAEARVKKNGWPLEQFILLRRDLRRVAPDFLNDVLATTGAPKVLSTHALTVFPDYEAVIRRLIGALPAGSRFSFLEVTATPGARGYHLLNLLGHADVSRPVWNPVQEMLDHYSEERLPLPSYFIQASLWIGAGVKAGTAGSDSSVYPAETKSD